jgi:hypothetical protein
MTTTITTTTEQMRQSWPDGAIAYKYSDPIENARWIYDQREARKIAAEDPNLLVWLEDDEA